MRLFFVLAFFTFLIWATNPTSMGDAVIYAQDVLLHADGQPSHFWEFGHIWWRPWGELGTSFLLPLFQQIYGDTGRQAVLRFFILTSFLSGLLSLALFDRILARFCNPTIQTLTLLAMAGGHALLCFSQSAPSYVPAQLFLTLALYSTLRALEAPHRPSIWAAAAGAAFALACTLWFPVCVCGLGVIAFFYSSPLYLKNNTVRREPMTALIWVFLVGLGTVYLLSLGIAAKSAGVQTATQFMVWFREASHGWSQTLNVVRLILGWGRAFYEFGDDNILIKRILFRDPYSQPNLLSFAGPLGVRLAICYVAMALIALRLLGGERRRMGWILLAGLCPLVLFAVFLFEAASTERFLPAYPFVFLAIAYLLQLDWQRKWVRLPLLVFLGSLPLLNLLAMTFGSNEARTEVLTRQTELEAKLGSQDALVLVPHLRDRFFADEHVLAMDPVIGRRKFTTNFVVQLSNEGTPVWRNRFARQTLKTWSEGKSVWLSTRALATRPQPDWRWVEGDDPRVKWTDFPAFFQSFQYGPSTGADGFVELLKEPSNLARLNTLAAADNSVHK